MPNPVADRPKFPEGYVSKWAGEPFPIEHLRTRMESSPIYWVSSITKSGLPYVRPIWGGWIDDVLYLEGSPQNGTFVNLARKPYAVVHIDSDGGRDVAIVEGPIDVMESMDEAIFKRLQDQMAAKYTSYGYKPESGAGMRRLKPKKAYAWHGMDTATRWTWS